MSATVRGGFGWLGLCLAWVVPLGLAGDAVSLADLQARFERRDYTAVQDGLSKLDRAPLSEPERQTAQRLDEQLPAALGAQLKARAAVTAGDKAYVVADWDAADKAYATVEDNPHASPADARYAAAQRERIAGRRGQSAPVLASAAPSAIEPMQDVGGGSAKPRQSSAASPSQASAPGGTSAQSTGAMQPMQPVSPAAPSAQPATSQPTLLPSAAPTVPQPNLVPERLTPADQMRLEDDLRWQRAVAQAETLAAKARDDMAANDYAEADKAVTSALQTIEAARRFADPAEKYEAVRASLDELQAQVQAGRAAYEDTQAQHERDEISERQAIRIAQQEALKREKIEQLFNSASQLRREQRFTEAAEVLRQILMLDPTNAQAQSDLTWAEDFESIGRQEAAYEERHSQQRRALMKAEESLIPWDYDVLYPKNWLELTAQRASSKGGQFGGQGFEDQELNRRLDEVLPEVRFNAVPLEGVINHVQELGDINIAVDWADLDMTMVEPAREKPISLQLKNVKTRTVLNEVLTQAGGEVRLAYQVRDGVLRIASKDRLDRDKFVLAYDVRDLLAEVPNAKRPDQDSASATAVDGGGASSRGQSLFGSVSYQDVTDPAASSDRPKMEQIKDVILKSVEPDSWIQMGAGPSGGSLQDINGQLLVYNTSAAHQQVVDLLGMLRETQALQVSVESRFLDVISNFLEQFGVDLDFVMNSGSAGFDRDATLVDPFTGAPVLIPRQFSRIGELPNTPGLGTVLNQQTAAQPYGNAGLVPSRGGIGPHIDEMTPISAQQGSLSLVDPSALNTEVPNSFAQRSGLQPAINIAGSFLDNLQVDFLIRATQANQRSSVVQAPRAVMLNGQAVQIRVQRERTYVSSLNPIVGENVGVVQPITNVIPSGVQMWVQGVISSDRRYTTLSISVVNQGEPTFDRFETQRGSGNSPSTFILLPTYSRIDYTTTVSVPDGGTVLLGGFKQVGEIEVEAGVPILSKIPILKRAFTNTASIKDTRTLLILVKSKILIQKEAEEEAFPTFSGLGG